MPNSQGNGTKSLWTNITHAAHALPQNTDLLVAAEQPGTDLVTQVKEFTVLELATFIGGGGGLLKQATTVLTNAQVLTLPTTPVNVVPAVGGKLLYVLGGVIQFHWVADYTNIVGGFGLLRYAGTFSDIWGSLVSTASNFLDGGASKTALAVPFFLGGGNMPYYVATISGLGIDASYDNGIGGDFTGGNAGNTMTYQILYVEI